MMKSAQIGKYIYSTKPIGKGAYSKVYKGFNSETDEIIALKIVDKGHVKPDAFKRIKAEVRILEQLTHPNIIKLLEFHEDEDYFYLILEYCAGGDLSNYIRSEGKIDEDRAKKYMRQIVESLRYLKRLNIVHRDLKPQNILLSADKHTIKLTDFNFARELYENDLSQTICGSPLYMAPEIIEKHQYTTKADMWSIGMILYEMVYGMSPYSDSHSMIDLLHKVKTRPVKYTNRVSQDCNDFIAEMLDLNVETRLDWEALFKHPWLDLEEPNYLATEPEHIWESITLSTVAKSKPMEIGKARVVDDYIPICITPPEATRSDMSYKFHNKRGSIVHSGKFEPSSAPEAKTLGDHLWSYMSGSVNIIKGAVDYISNTDPRTLFTGSPNDN